MNIINWDLPVCTGHSTPLIGDVTGRRGGLENRIAVELPSPSQYKPQLSATTAYFADDGVARFDRQPCEWDLVNFDPNDGIQRIRLDRAEMSR